VKTNRAALLLSLIVLIGACGTLPASSREDLSGGVLTDSIWGSAQETFTVLGGGATFEGLCVDGAIDGPIVLSEAGAFTANGTLRRKGGARADDATAPAVRYQGTIRGDVLTLKVAGSDGAPILMATLRKGVRGQAHPCA